MERGNTKQEILDASLELFSVQGFEATSISQIAGAVGIRKASLYSHFESKQAILDALVEQVLKQYRQHSLFVHTDWEKTEIPQTAEDMVRMIQGQLRYILHDPAISRARKMLVIEQFQNPELAQLQTKQNYTDVMDYFTGLMRQLIRRGVLAEDDHKIMAAQFCLPISVWMNLCDREPDREQEIMELAEKHIRQFFRRYQPKREPRSDLYDAYRVKNIYGDNYAGVTKHYREASRAVVTAEGRILLSHEVNIAQWMLPGGGMEAGETPEDCCVRELSEETGLLVKPRSCFLILNEFYEDWKFVSYYFLCDVVGRTERKPTKREIEVGAVPKWLEMEQALELFSHYQDYGKTNEERRGIYFREYLALSEIRKGYIEELEQGG